MHRLHTIEWHSKLGYASSITQKCHLNPPNGSRTKIYAANGPWVRTFIMVYIHEYVCNNEYIAYIALLKFINRRFSCMIWAVGFFREPSALLRSYPAIPY